MIRFCKEKDMSLHIVLFEPEIPQNTGNIARTCAVIGAKLDLVYPIGFSLDEKHLKRAGLDYWSQLEITKWKDIAQFMEVHGQEKQLFLYTTKAPKSYHKVIYTSEGDTYLVFGKESAGIPEEVLVEHKENCVRIPMRPALRSLNLSNSVAIAAYEYLRQTDFIGLQGQGQLHHSHWKD
jgi:tRNA (cytidine/uridine-2'-O-)-methyltransferase